MGSRNRDYGRLPNLRKQLRQAVRDGDRNLQRKLEAQIREILKDLDE